jgi:hypothetical protein
MMGLIHLILHHLHKLLNLKLCPITLCSSHQPHHHCTATTMILLIPIPSC